MLKKTHSMLFSASNRQFYLSAFRVYLACHVLLKIALVMPYYDFAFGIEGLNPASGSLPIFFFFDQEIIREQCFSIIALLSVLCVLMAFGVGKNAVVFLVFLLVEVLQRSNGFILNGGDNLLKFNLLYLSVCDSFSYLSTGSAQRRRSKESRLSNLLTNLGVASIILHLLLVYFVSAVSKIHSDVWFNGIAVYYIMNLDRFSGSALNSIIGQNEYLVTIGTYGTILLELVFPFAAFHRTLRFPLLFMGILLHLSIFYFMMIHEFQLLFIAHYGFFFSDQEYRSAYCKLREVFRVVLPEGHVHNH